MEPGIQGAWDRPSPGPQELSLVLLDRQEPQSIQGSALPFPCRPPWPSHVEEKLFSDMTADPQASPLPLSPLSLADPPLAVPQVCWFLEEGFPFPRQARGKVFFPSSGVGHALVPTPILLARSYP